MPQLVLSVDRKYFERYTIPLLKSLKNTSIKRAHVVCCNMTDARIPKLGVDVELSFLDTGTKHADYAVPRYLKALELVHRDDIVVADADSIFMSDITLPEKPVGLALRNDPQVIGDMSRIAAGLAMFRKGETKFLSRFAVELTKVSGHFSDQLALFHTYHRMPEIVESIRPQISWQGEAPLYSAKGPLKRGDYYKGLMGEWA